MDEFVQIIDERMTVLTEKRDELRKYVKRSIPDTERDQAKERITDLTSELRKLRHEKHLCEDIHARASDLDKRVRMVDEERGMRREVR